MPIFDVKSPDGQTVEVTAPDGATEQQAISYAQEHWAELSKGGRVTDGVVEKPKRSVISDLNSGLAATVEVPLSMASGLLGQVVGGTSRAETAIYDWAKEKLTGEVAQEGHASDVGKQVANAFTYEPQSYAGKNINENLGKAFNWATTYPRMAGQAAQDYEKEETGRTTLTDIAGGVGQVALAAVTPESAAGLILHPVKTFKDAAVATGDAVKAITKPIGDVADSAKTTIQRAAGVTPEMERPLNRDETIVAAGRSLDEPMKTSMRSLGRESTTHWFANQAREESKLSYDNFNSRTHNAREELALPKGDTFGIDDVIEVGARYGKVNEEIKSVAPVTDLTTIHEKLRNEVRDVAKINTHDPKLHADMPSEETLAGLVENILSRNKDDTSALMESARLEKKKASDALMHAPGEAVPVERQALGDFHLRVAHLIDEAIYKSIPVERLDLVRAKAEELTNTAKAYTYLQATDAASGKIMGPALARIYEKSPDKFSGTQKILMEHAGRFEKENQNVGITKPMFNYMDVLVSGHVARSIGLPLAAGQAVLRGSAPGILASEWHQKGILGKREGLYKNTEIADREAKYKAQEDALKEHAARVAAIKAGERDAFLRATGHEPSELLGDLHYKKDYEAALAQETARIEARRAPVNDANSVMTAENIASHADTGETSGAANPVGEGYTNQGTAIDGSGRPFQYTRPTPDQIDPNHPNYDPSAHMTELARQRSIELYDKLHADEMADLEAKWKATEKTQGERNAKAEGQYKDAAKSSAHGKPVDGKAPVDADGFVMSETKSPIYFEDQKGAARWILGQGNKLGGGQVFEIHNYPGKDGFTVRQTHINEPKASTGEKMPAPTDAEGKIPEPNKEPSVSTIPLKGVAMQQTVKQFKGGANAVGVVKGKRMTEPYDMAKAEPITLWRRKDGSLEVVQGRHTLDQARTSKAENIKAQIYDEAAGYTAKDMEVLDIQKNSKANRGTATDYENFFRKHPEIDEAQAERMRLLESADAKTGFKKSKTKTDAERETSRKARKK